MRAVLTFRCGSTGWREEYFLDPDTPALRATGRRLAQARSLVSSVPTILQSYHIANVDDPRHPVSENVNLHCVWQIRTSPYFIVVPFSVVDYDVAFKMYFRTPGGASRVVTICGVPQLPRQTFTYPGFTDWLPMYLKDVDKFRDALLSPLLRLAIREEVPANDDTAAYVESIDVDPLGRYRLHLAGDLPLPRNARVRCNGATGNNLGRLRGLRRVKVQPDARTLVLDKGPIPDRGPLLYLGNDMLVRSITYQYGAAFWVPSGEQTVEIYDYPAAFVKILRNTLSTLVRYHLGSRHRGGLRGRRRGRKPKRKPLD